MATRFYSWEPPVERATRCDTGIEVIAPGGVGRENFWNLLSNGRTATRGITFFDPAPFRSRVAAEADFDPYEHGPDPAGGPPAGPGRAVRRRRLTRRRRRQRPRHPLPGPAPRGRHRRQRRRRHDGPGPGVPGGQRRGRLDTVDHTYAVPHLYDYMVPSSFAAEVAWAVGAEGPSTVVSTGCTSGIDSVGYAVELVREGSADVVIAGSSDAPISPITMACFDAIKATTPRHDEPECGLPAVRQDPQRIRPRRGNRLLRPGGTRQRPQARRPHLRRDRRLRHPLQRLPHDGPAPDGVEMAEAIDLALGEAG